MWITGAPFLLEGTCLLIVIIAVILSAVPLVSYVNKLFGNNVKFKENKSGIKLKEIPSTTNCPSPLPLPSATLELSVLHSPYPTPVNKSSEEESIANNEDNCSSGGEELSENALEKSYPLSVSYNSYRHKLIEETLRKHYGGGYAPGNVILNLIQLNTADSSARFVLAQKYDRSFFDLHIQRRVSAPRSGIKPEIEFPDQLAHFIPKNLRKPSTTETQTETANPSEISVLIKPSVLPSTRPNTPATSCQRIISKRSHEAADHSHKSPFPTPVHSQAPLDANQKSDSVRIREQPVLTEQLYRRNDTRPDVVSRTHVEAEEYLNRITKNKRYEVARKEILQEPRIRSSLKKSRRTNPGGRRFSADDEKTVGQRTGDFGKLRRSLKDEIRHLSTSKPTIWNN